MDTIPYLLVPYPLAYYPTLDSEPKPTRGEATAMGVRRRQKKSLDRKNQDHMSSLEQKPKPREPKKSIITSAISGKTTLVAYIIRKHEFDKSKLLFNAIYNALKPPRHKRGVLLDRFDWLKTEDADGKQDWRQRWFRLFVVLYKLLNNVNAFHYYPSEHVKTLYFEYWIQSKEKQLAIKNDHMARIETHLRKKQNEYKALQFNLTSYDVISENDDIERMCKEHDMIECHMNKLQSEIRFYIAFKSRRHISYLFWLNAWIHAIDDKEEFAAQYLYFSVVVDWFLEGKGMRDLVFEWNDWLDDWLDDLV